jgi:allantoinase
VSGHGSRPRSRNGTLDERFDLVLRGRAVLPDGTRPVDVGVRGERIAAVSDTPLTGGTVRVLGDDEVLLPGLVDTHVHVNDPGRTEWEGFPTATRAAAAGGVTTLVDMPLNSIPPTVDPAALAVKRGVAQGSVAVDVGFWGGAVPGNLGRLRDLHEQGVLGFKCFLAPSGVDEFGHLDADGLERALAEVASFDGLLLVHAEDPVVLDAHAALARGRDYAAFVASRPDDAETTAIRRVVDGVRRTGARAHVLHLSSAAALPLLATARAEGLPITVETCPHYLVFDAEHIPDGATQYKCCPPIRDANNADALWQGLLDGVIDQVVSDHSPSTPELKLAGDGDFSVAWGGIAGLQVGLAAVWTHARRRGIALDDVVRWMAAAPARLAGLPMKGAIRVGADADLVVLAPDEPWAVAAGALEHRNAVTAYDGARLHGVVRRTWLRGTAVHPRPERATPRGRLLDRGHTADT